MTRSRAAAAVVGLALVVVACGQREKEPSAAALAAAGEATVAARDGDLGGALAALERARAADPASPFPSVEAARLLERMGLYPEAVEAWEEAMARAPKSPRPRLGLAAFYRRTGRAVLARGAVAEAESITARDPDVQLEVGRLYVEAGNEVEMWQAATVLGAALRARPEDAEAYYLLGRLERLRRAFGEAQAAFERALQKDARHYPALVELGAMLGDPAVQRSREGLRALELALAERPLPAATAAEVARLEEQLGRAEAGRAWRDLARRLHEPERELEAARNALWRAPRDPEARRRFTLALLAAGRSDEALGVARGSVHLEPQGADAWALVAAGCEQAGDAAGLGRAVARVEALAADAAEAARLLAEAREHGRRDVPALAPPGLDL